MAGKIRCGQCAGQATRLARRMVRAEALWLRCQAVFIVLMTLTGPSQADADFGLFEQLLIAPATTAKEHCQNLVVTERVRQWRARHEPVDPFKSVTDIRAEVNPEALQQSMALGCGATNYWAFMACTQLDAPEDTLIVPRGQTATTDQQMLEIIERCLDDMASEMLIPTNGN